MVEDYEVFISSPHLVRNQPSNEYPSSFVPTIPTNAVYPFVLIIATLVQTPFKVTNEHIDTNAS